MRHLRPDEFAELIDGQLSAARATHIEGCAACRAQAADLRDALRRVSAGDVPEPSPLFWQHFSSRVQEAVRSEQPVHDARVGWIRHPAAAWALSAFIAVLVLAAVFGRAMLPRGPSSGSTSQGQANAVSGEPAAVPNLPPLDGDIEDDGAWALVRVVAEDVPWEDAQAAGISAAPGAAENLALELTQNERAELARLIETELKQNGA